MVLPIAVPAATLGLALGDLRLGRPELIHAVWITAAVAAVLLLAGIGRTRRLRRLADRELLRVIAPTHSKLKRTTKSLFVSLACATAAIGLAQPQHSPEERDVTRTGREIAVLVDVSRSMLATDLAPSRLERTKIWVNDLLPELRGDKIALVAFAGGASVRCPLTVDHGFFKIALEELSPDAAPRGGTYIGDAIRKTCADVFNLDVTADGGGAAAEALSDAPSARDIILITDGEDQETLPRAAAEAAARLGVRIIAIGVGSRENPVPVPVAPGAAQYVTDESGNVVRTGLEDTTLRDLVGASPANRYLPVATGEIDLATVYNDLIATAEQADLGTARVREYREAYWLFAAITLGLLVADSLLGERRSRAIRFMEGNRS